MTQPLADTINISVKSAYLAEQSEPNQARYVFIYYITISNIGEQAVKLLSRHWIITDANGEVQEVQGAGVIGEQPILEPGESFEYTSGTIISTPVGSMHGTYTMQLNTNQEFIVPIPAFSLAVPNILH